MIGGMKNLVTEACGINKRRNRRISDEVKILKYNLIITILIEGFC